MTNHTRGFTKKWESGLRPGFRVAPFKMAFLCGEGEDCLVRVAAEAVVPDIVDFESIYSQDLRGGTRQVFVDDEYHGAQPMARIFSSARWA